MKVEIWSDVVCPWCYIGKRRFKAALSRFPHRDQVEVVWRSFELDPTAPQFRPGVYAERLATKYGMSVPEAQANIDRIVQLADNEGLVFNFDVAKPGNTFDAHRLLHLAHTTGAQNALKERLMAAYFTEGAAIGHHEVLTKLATEAGLDSIDIQAVLETDAYAAEVRADEARARNLGITAVPFFALDGTYGIPGAQPTEVLLEVLDDAWTKSDRTVEADGSHACTDKTCEVTP